MSSKKCGITTPQEQETLLTHRRAKLSKPTKRTVRSIKTNIPVSSPTEILNINTGRNNTPQSKAPRPTEKHPKKVSRPLKVPAKSLRPPTKSLFPFPNLQYETEKLLRILSRHSGCPSFKRELKSFGDCKLLEDYISLRQNR